MHKRLLLILCLALPLTGCIDVLVTGAGFVYDRNKIKYDIRNRKIQSDVSNYIYQHRHDSFKDAHVDIAVYNFDVLLAGQVASPKLRNEIECVARETKSVRRVYNFINIAKPTSVSRRLKDSVITTAVIAKLVANDVIFPNRYKIVTENGTVYLMGRVTKERGEIAAALAALVKGVRKVVKVFQYFVIVD